MNRAISDKDAMWVCQGEGAKSLPHPDIAMDRFKALDRSMVNDKGAILLSPSSRGTSPLRDRLNALDRSTVNDTGSNVIEYVF